MRTIVHAGFHKTGTTALQEWCASAAPWLATQGVSYPAEGRGPMSGHHLLACALASARTGSGPNDLFLSEREVFRTLVCGDQDAAPIPPEVDGATRVVSSEIFSTYDADELARLSAHLGGIDRVTLYYRGGMAFLYSCWATKVRWGAARSFREFLHDTVAMAPRTPIAGALGCVANVVAVLGEPALDLRSYERAVARPGGLVGDFVEHVLGLGGAPFAAHGRANVSPTPAESDLLRGLAQLDLGLSSPGLRARLARLLSRDHQARGLVASLHMAIAAVSARLCLRDIDPHAAVINDDGRVRAGSPHLRDRLAGWRFHPDEPWSTTETGPLLETLSARTETADLLALLAAQPA